MVMTYMRHTNQKTAACSEGKVYMICVMHNYIHTQKYSLHGEIPLHVQDVQVGQVSAKQSKASVCLL